MQNRKNLKIIRENEQTSNKMKWLNFSQEMMTTQKSSEYMNMILSDTLTDKISDEMKLEAMVREQLRKEFSGNVEKMKSYKFLVDAVMHNLKKKQLQAKDEKGLI